MDVTVEAVGDKFVLTMSANVLPLFDHAIVFFVQVVGEEEKKKLERDSFSVEPRLCLNF